MSIWLIVSLRFWSRFLKWILPANHGFQGKGMLILYQIDLFRWVEEIHVSLKRTVSMLDAAACNTLFPCENWINFWKEYCLPITVYKGEKLTFCSKYAYSAKVKKEMYFSKKNHLL
jgi:hypothetical protein